MYSIETHDDCSTTSLREIMIDVLHLPSATTDP